MVHDIWYRKHCIWVASTAKQLRKYWKNLKKGWKQSLAPSVPSIKCSKIKQKQIPKFLCPAQFCLIAWDCFINFACHCPSKKIIFVTCPTLLQTSIVWCLLNLECLSLSPNVNIMWVHCVKVLQWTVFVNSILPVWFRSKSIIKKLLDGVISW